MSQEFWPGLSENPFGRKLSFKLYETWYFWGVKLGYINYTVSVHPTLARPPKTHVAEIWSWIKTRHFSPLLTGLCFIDSLNSCMMNVRWRFYQFWNQIPQEKQQELIPWGRCFACSLWRLVQLQFCEPCSWCPFTCSRLGQNLSELEVKTFVSIQRVIWDCLLASNAEIIQRHALLSFLCRTSLFV